NTGGRNRLLRTSCFTRRAELDQTEFSSQDPGQPPSAWNRSTGQSIETGAAQRLVLNSQRSFCPPS
ncbi:hypothetical protein LEMLEM_LOCUS15596, partial [Lemmus lemmus]